MEPRSPPPFAIGNRGNRATALLNWPSPTSTHIVKTNILAPIRMQHPQYDAKMADGTYMASCAALAAG
ncbi:hypothetical protein D5086_004705 [Populus alba]|uniref:Uncharacterized protein n=1 Tax=Populus alba TaxID=43335 RepID=A0ACC4CRH8_POPAL